ESLRQGIRRCERARLPRQGRRRRARRQAAASGVLMSDVTLAELCIVAGSEAWRGNGELLASGIGVAPRLAASLAKLTHSPELLMTDSETFLVEEPIPLGA